MILATAEHHTFPRAHRLPAVLRVLLALVRCTACTSSPGQFHRKRHNPPRFAASVHVSSFTRSRHNVRQIESSAAMARVDHRCQPNTSRQRFHHDCVHLIVHNLPSRSMIQRQNRLVKSVIFIAVPVFYLRPVARKVEEERISSPRAVQQPLHSINDVVPRGTLARNARHFRVFVGENVHIALRKVKLGAQKMLNETDVVHASF
mmetsp:Transcript_353/g.686  ORF Transcript_353/g.686 Transcript_353/m.686 type:complete len:204 (-) Transcript_353:689-1300(-)